MNYHVFIVDINTFKYHLEYLFAGTGAGKKKAPFLSSCSDTTTHSSTERNLVNMISDVSRIRIDDKIIFYLQSKDNNQGRFFGVFKASSLAFFDENDSKNFKRNELKKGLTFRVQIEPDEVYPQGVSEHEYLDLLDGITCPHEMCWSLIYRKLKGNRGCTMITEYEFKSLLDKLKKKNSNTPISNMVRGFTFDEDRYEIKSSNGHGNYKGRKDSINICERMIYKANKKNAFEVHLQAYILQNFDNATLEKKLLPLVNHPCWIGNEVSCGVGMQRIDVMIQQTSGDDVYIKIIELKCVEPNMYILDEQLPWYITWVMSYMAPNYVSQGKKVHIIPCIIALNTQNSSFIDKSRVFSDGYTSTVSIVVEPLEYISFEINDSAISFNKVV